MPRIKPVHQFFGQGAFHWIDRSYLVDWAIVGLILLLSGVITLSPVYKRDIDPSDPQINHPHRKNQVSSPLNHGIAFLVPFLAFLVAGFLRKSLLVIHHAVIALCVARGLARLFTEFLKHGIGRLRPDFLARCEWDKIIEECTGSKKHILDGRKSFPSGHSSTAFSGMFFLSLWLAGQTAAWCFSVPKASRNLRSSRMLLLTITILPLIWAAYVAISRLQDYRHHKEDIIVGSLLGCICALLSYLIYWPNPFSASSFETREYGQPRIVYADQEVSHGRNDSDFELGRLEADEVLHE